MNAINRVVITGKLTHKESITIGSGENSFGLIRAIVSQVDERKKESAKGKHMNQFIITASGPAALTLDRIDVDGYIKVKGSLQGRQSINEQNGAKGRIFQQIFVTDADDVEAVPNAIPVINESMFTGRIFQQSGICTQFITKVPGGDPKKNPDLVKFVIQSGVVKKQFEDVKMSTVPLNLVFCIYKPKDPENFAKIAARFDHPGTEIAAVGALISVYHDVPGQKVPSYRLELIVRELQIFRDPIKFVPVFGGRKEGTNHEVSIDRGRIDLGDVLAGPGVPNNDEVSEAGSSTEELDGGVD